VVEAHLLLLHQEPAVLTCLATLSRGAVLAGRECSLLAILSREARELCAEAADDSQAWSNSGHRVWYSFSERRSPTPNERRRWPPSRHALQVTGLTPVTHEARG